MSGWSESKEHSPQNSLKQLFMVDFSDFWRRLYTQKRMAKKIITGHSFPRICLGYLFFYQVDSFFEHLRSVGTMIWSRKSLPRILESQKNLLHLESSGGSHCWRIFREGITGKEVSWLQEVVILYFSSELTHFSSRNSLDYLIELFHQLGCTGLY